MRVGEVRIEMSGVDDWGWGVLRGYDWGEKEWVGLIIR